mmetsp:Transcript_8743/g.15655  ORF Transcript_8743/g.15655 Transcript_8743/m.15655 type:complete len:158 (+) Transcript_8743:172-645(+)
MSQAVDTSYGNVDASLPASAQADVRVEQLMQMGFDAKLAERALRRANNNYEDAITMLSAGMVPDEDEFDVLAEAENEGTSGGTARPPAKVVETKQSEDPFTANLPKDAPASAILDSRIETLMGMGFEAADAENALRVAGDDFDVALQLLTSVDETSA